jgi:hypothetical protein
MKKSLVVLLIISIPVIFSSCRKCSTCTIKNKKTDGVINVLTEKCGSSSEIEDYENKARADYPDSLYIVNCIGEDSKD